MTRVGIVGCGLIGHKRARHLPGAQLGIVCDLDLGRAELLANSFSDCRSTTRLDELFAACEVVVVSTANHALCDIAVAAVRAGKHVLLEKPGAIRSVDLETLQREASERGALVRIGYNHRFHPALQRARLLVDADAVGELMFVRARYGHGGRVGYDREWRADPALSGGGELIDQGVHLIDLARWFLGPFTQVAGAASTFFWKMPVDDNAFLHLRTARGATAWLHASCTEWKNLFSFEIYGRAGKLHVEGLGGSYGLERLSYYKMLPEMGPPETTVWEYPRGDRSWELEFAEFLEDIRLQRTPEPGLAEGIETLQIVEEIYRLSTAQSSSSSSSSS